MRLILVVVVGLLLVAAVCGLGIYLAARYVPQFYQEAIAVPSASSREGSDRMLQRSTALASDLKRGGRWAALFTPEELNGWLAVDLVENHGNSLPSGVEAPRVAFTADRLMLACRYRLGILSTVLWLEVEPYLTGPNAVAVRLRKVRAGRLPVPMQSVLEAIDGAVRHTDLRIEWSQTEGDPVAVISMPPQQEAGRQFTLDTLRIRDGKLYAAGTSRKK
jgi:hypothetical protein